MIVGWILGIITAYFIGHLIGHLMKRYKIVRKNHVETNSLVEINTNLINLRTGINAVWAVLQANGYQTNAYNATYNNDFVQDYSGYNFTGYSMTTGYIPTGNQESSTIQTPEGPIVPEGPIGAVGVKGEFVVLGAAIPSYNPPIALPEVDYLEEPRLT